MVYIAYLLYDEVEHVKFKYVWAVLFLWLALDKIQNRREVDTLHGGFHVLIHSVLNCHICTDSQSILRNDLTFKQNSLEDCLGL